MSTTRENGTFRTATKVLETLRRGCGDAFEPVYQRRWIADSVCAVGRARARVHKSGSHNISHDLHPGKRREMLTSINRDEVLTNLPAWISALLGTKSFSTSVAHPNVVGAQYPSGVAEKHCIA